MDDNRVSSAPLPPIRLPELDPKLKTIADLVIVAAEEKAKKQLMAHKELDAETTFPLLAPTQRKFDSELSTPCFVQMLLDTVLLLLGIGMMAGGFYLAQSEARLKEERNRSYMAIQARFFASSVPLPAPIAAMSTAKHKIQKAVVPSLPPVHNTLLHYHRLTNSVYKPSLHAHRDAGPGAKSIHQYQYFAGPVMKPGRRFVASDDKRGKRRSSIFIRSKRNHYAGSDGFPTEHIDPNYDQAADRENKALP